MYQLKKIIFILIVAILTFILVYLCYTAFEGYSTSSRISMINKNRYSIFIDITESKLYLIDISTGKSVKSYPIASGKSSTPSPLGTWKIISKGDWGKGFGGEWLGLNVPWGTYGIHGTNRPGSIGYAVSHGCIRMFNKDVEELSKFVGYGTTVVIYGGPYGPFGNGFRVIKPGCSGADVYEVQKIMKNRGYYPYAVDGIYGEGMKRYVIKFRVDNHLSLTHDINGEFYKALGIRLMD
ncbi:L,D-transpeptidase family protein [Fonticella tunisiensis]|uniref:L,D-transpeptidase family protein n=1 Tax=Fonticella tunisiensis TaxID=1096341 RepID=UPI001414EEE7|nr:L,D-transpeptidase family protein [Fonticella tunisiensis]